MLVPGGEPVFGCEASSGELSPRMERESAPAAPSCWLHTAGMSSASAGIWGRESLRGPPQAEQDMEVGVFCRVQRRQSQDRLLFSAFVWFRSPDGALSRPEQLLERWGRGWSPGGSGGLQ